MVPRRGARQHADEPWSVPHTSAETLRARLRRLHQHQYLRQHRLLHPAGSLWLYTVGPAALLPGDARPWQPSLAQTSHTLAVGDTLVALTRTGFCPGLTITSWQGEAEIRAWAAPGAPYPDAHVAWQHERAAR